MTAADAAVAQQSRRKQQLQAALASKLHRCVPHADIKHLGPEAVLPALVIAHLRATMKPGDVFCIPRIGCETAVTDIEAVLGVGNPLFHIGKMEAEANEHGLSLHIETPEAALALPMGKTMFFEVIHTAPSRQKLVQASAVAGRFTCADIIVHFLPVVLDKTFFDTEGKVLLKAEAGVMTCVHLSRLTPAVLVAGLRKWQKSPHFHYSWASNLRFPQGGAQVLQPVARRLSMSQGLQKMPSQ